MKSFFDWDDYRKLMSSRIQLLPQSGRGELGRLAKSLGIHTSQVSKIFSSSADLTPEQSHRACLHFGFNSLETDYFVALVAWSRAGTPEYRAFMQARLDRIRSESHALQHRFAAQDQIGSLGESERAIFYSSWMYPAIALACDIPGFQSVDRIAARLHLERSVVAKAVEFLLSVGLCVEQSGEIRAGLKRTHLETGSPLVTQHHIHWRLKALERIPRLGPEELAFSSPLCTSHAHLARIREKTLQFLSEILAEVRETPSETLACLNVDFFSL